MWTDTGQLVGRLEELGAIRDALRDRHGVHLLVIEGTPGIGKTRLLEEAAATADTGGARVLRARGSELERQLPFGVMRQLLEPALRGVPASERAELLSGDAALATSALDVRPTQHIVDGFAVLAGLYWLIAGIAAAEPLVLCIDDLHWADEPSLRALAYLLGRLEGVDAQLCVALRPHEPGSEEALLSEITAAPRAVTIRPSPLDRDAVTALLRTRLDPGADPAFCAACEVTTHGNPLLVCELARELADRGVEATAAAAPTVAEVIPRGIAPSVLRRVQRVHPQASLVAGAAAILGDGAEPRLVAALAGLDPGAANAVLESLVRVEVLARADPPAFAHPLVRAAIAAAVEAEDRGRLHLEAARLLAADGAPPERLAVHLTETPPAGDPWVVDTLTAAGQEAVARGAPGPAARLLRRALSEPPAAGREAAVLLATGQAEARAGDARAIAHLQRAIESAPDATTHAQAALLLVQLLGPAGQLKAGIDLALSALARMDPDSELWRRLEAEMLSLAVMDSSHRAFAVAAAGPARPGDAGRRAGRMHAAGDPLQRGARAGTLAGRGGRTGRARPGGRVADGVDPHVRPCDQRPHAQRPTTARRSRCGAISWPTRGPAATSWGSRWRTPSALRRTGTRGRWTRPSRTPISRCTSGRRGCRRSPRPSRSPSRPRRSSCAEISRPRAPRSRWPPGPRISCPVPILLSARGRLRLAEGRLLDALEDMRLVGRLVEQWMSDNTALAPWRAEAALALHGLGETDEARELIAREVADARRWGDPWLLGQALRAQALVGPEGERISVLGEAVALLRASEARLELALALLELGVAQHASGLRWSARQALREVLELATDCAAPAVADRARAALIAAGGRPRRAAATGPLALTPTERRVARLAASGAGNREIAQTLFVTEKTIETHLASAYRKLGIRARGQLAAALTSSA